MRVKDIAVLVSSGLLLAACGSKGTAPAAGAAAGARGAMPAMPVQVETAAVQPISDTATFVASVQSLDSMVITPLVGGIIRQIFVRSGENVAAGAPLMQLDPALQAAQVANLESSRASLTPAIAFDKVQMQRAQQLYQEKIGDQQDFQQAESTYNAAVAQADSLDAQIQQAKVTLSYYRVTAPRAGTVGDLPVKTGDQVTAGTELTTLDSPQGLEVYVQVPLEQASRLKPGLPVAVLDGEDNVLAESTIYFVSPQVDNTTQTILAKAALNGPTRERLRAQQYVQARITWGAHAGFEVPLLATIQQGASSFLELAQPQGQGFVVGEIPVTLGPIAGNNVEVTTGLKAGDKVIVSSHQILMPGMPVMPMTGPPGGGRGAGAAAGSRGGR